MPKLPDQTDIPSQAVLSSSHKKLFIGIILIILLIVISVGIALVLARNNRQPTNLISAGETTQENQEQPLPVATPFPFEDLTIPFLKQKNYQSQLGALDKLSDNGTFTSYLTSYTSDGLKINGLLTIPSGIKPANGWPAIVFVHGYIPPNQYQTQTRYIDHVNSLANNGFVVFKIDLRGHGNSEGEAGGGYFSSDYVSDTLNAYSALQATDFVNSQKIGLWGHSMAGNIALRAMAAKPTIPAVVIWAGAVYTYSDMMEYGIQDSSYQPQPSDSGRQRKRQQLRALYGDPTPESWFWQLVAPTNYLSDLKGAIQLNHAINDEVVSVEYSRNLSKLLNESRIPHQLHEYPSGGHNISNPSFNQAIQNTIIFYTKYLK